MRDASTHPAYTRRSMQDARKARRTRLEDYYRRRVESRTVRARSFCIVSVRAIEASPPYVAIARPSLPALLLSVIVVFRTCAHTEARSNVLAAQSENRDIYIRTG